MSGSHINLADAARSRLRALIAALDQEIERLPKSAPAADGKTPPDSIRVPWAELVATLALGPEPELRQCPVCGNFGMRAATLCSYCWTKLTPPI